MLTREKILEIYEAGPEAVTASFREFEATIDKKDSLIVELGERVKVLEARLNQNSQNSSKPSSTDVFVNEKPKPKSRRQSSGKKPGGQKGHPGKTLEQTETPDHIIVHPPHCCDNCGCNLENTEAHDYKRRQEVDIPPVKATVTEHRAESKKCPNCGKVNKGTFPDSIKFPIQYGPRLLSSFVYFRNFQLIPYKRICDFAEDFYGIRISPATIKRAEKEFFQNLEPFEKAAFKHLQEAYSVHCDETGMRVLGTKWWLHVVSNDLWTYYFAHPKRGSEAMNALGFLPEYEGIVVHDGWASYNMYGCEHALCNAHLKRELTGVEENFEQQWAKEINELLSQVKKYTDECREMGIPIDPIKVKAFEEIYDEIIQEGIEENPPPDPSKQVKKRGRPAQTKAKNLLDRFIKYKDRILKFLNDLRVPFDNNQAERDIRMMKLQQKISGTFRSIEGAVAFCRIRGYISTIRKNNLNVMDAIRAALNGAPLLS